MQSVCIFFHVPNICRKFAFYFSMVVYSDVPKVRGDVIWVLYQISYAFQQCKNFENQLRFDKVTESLKVGTF